MGIVHRLVAGTAVAGLMMGGLVAAPASAAPSVVGTKTYKACANKESGAIRLVLKGKKCKKSEIKLSWNVQGPAGLAGPVGPAGPQGATGPAGPPNATVFDGNNAAVSSVVSVDANRVLRLIDGGLWTFDKDTGAVTFDMFSEASLGLFYRNDTCTGDAYAFGNHAAAAGGQRRFVARTADRQAYRATSTVETTDFSWYANDGTGCQGPAAGVVVTLLAPVPRPSDLVGPLRYALN